MTNDTSNKSSWLDDVKVEVKKLMEESVFRTYVHEENSAIESLCASVNAVLNDGLRSHFLSIFEENHTLDLCRRIAKLCPEAKRTLDRMKHYQHLVFQPFNSEPVYHEPPSDTSLWRCSNGSTGTSLTRQRIIFPGRSGTTNGSASSPGASRSTLRRATSFKLSVSINGVTNQDSQCKHLWIRVALLEKVLDRIVAFLADNASLYYEKTAIMADRCTARLLADLLCGPCMLDYSRTRTTDYLFTDPPISELIRRHDLSGCLNSSRLPRVSPSSEMNQHFSEPPITESQCASVGGSPQLVNTASTAAAFTGPNKGLNFSVPGSAPVTRRNHVLAAKVHVESMHQSVRSTLVFGKNNVLIFTRESLFPIPGYLSIHDHGEELGVYIHWTPNGAIVSEHFPELGILAKEHNLRFMRKHSVASPSRCQHSTLGFLRDLYWDYAVRIAVTELAYIHCHKSGVTYSVVFINVEGLQLTQLLFQSENDLYNFLRCLEQTLVKYNGNFDPGDFAEDRDGTLLSGQDFSKHTSHDPYPLDSVRGFSLLGIDFQNKFSHRIANKESSVFGVKLSASLGLLTNMGRPSWECLSDKSESPALMTKDPEQRGTTSNSQDPPCISAKLRVHFANGRHNKLGNKLATSRKRFILPSNDCAEKTLRADARPSSPQPSVHVICSSIRWKILSVYFHHWLIFCRKLRMLKTRLSGVVFRDLITIDRPTHAPTGLSAALWDQITSGMAFDFTFREVCRHVYFGNCDPSIRPKVWPYLLGVYPWKASPEELEKLNFVNKSRYFHARSQWQSCPDSATNPHKQWEVNDFRNNHKLKYPSLLDISRGAHSRRWSADVHPDEINAARLRNKSTEVSFQKRSMTLTNNSPWDGTTWQYGVRHSVSSIANGQRKQQDISSTTASFGSRSFSGHFQAEENFSADAMDFMSCNLYRIDKDVTRCDRNHTFFAGSKSPTCTSDLNANLQKLRNIICTWVWLHLDVGYIQGMCDLLAPLLIILEDESLTYACFSALMEWMLPNFPVAQSETPFTTTRPVSAQTTPSPSSASQPTLLLLAQRSAKRTNAHPVGITNTKAHSIGGISPSSASLVNLSCTHIIQSPYTVAPASCKTTCMELRFSFLKDLVEIFDPELRQHFTRRSIDSHWYFCYRWLLLDFKRELKYEDVFSVWEVIWSSRWLVTYDFGIFIALAMLQYYRDIILYYDMDLTEILRFYNELSERHNARSLLDLARSFAFQIQNLLVDP